MSYTTAGRVCAVAACAALVTTWQGPVAAPAATAACRLAPWLGCPSSLVPSPSHSARMACIASRQNSATRCSPCPSLPFPGSPRAVVWTRFRPRLHPRPRRRSWRYCACPFRTRRRRCRTSRLHSRTTRFLWCPGCRWVGRVAEQTTSVVRRLEPTLPATPAWLSIGLVSSATPVNSERRRSGPHLLSSGH